MKSRRFLLSLSVGVGVEVVEVEVATLGCIFMHFSVLTFQFAVLYSLFSFLFNLKQRQILQIIIIIKCQVSHSAPFGCVFFFTSTSNPLSLTPSLPLPCVWWVILLRWRLFRVPGCKGLMHCPQQQQQQQRQQQQQLLAINIKISCCLLLLLLLFLLLLLLFCHCSLQRVETRASIDLEPLRRCHWKEEEKDCKETRLQFKLIGKSFKGE